MSKDLSLIFENKSKQWGLRGDPYLWAEIKYAKAREKEIWYFEQSIYEFDGGLNAEVL